MRTLQESLRSTSASLMHSFYVTMSYHRPAGRSAYWTVSVLGRAEFSRFSVTLCGKNPLAILRAILEAESPLASYTTVEGATCRSPSVREVEALAESHGVEAITLSYYPPSSWHPKGFFGATVHETLHSCVLSEEGSDTLRGSVLDALGRIRKAA